jgi:hypothetical protein
LRDLFECVSFCSKDLSSHFEGRLVLRLVKLHSSDSEA